MGLEECQLRSWATLLKRGDPRSWSPRDAEEQGWRPSWRSSLAKAWLGPEPPRLGGREGGEAGERGRSTCSGPRAAVSGTCKCHVAVTLRGVCKKSELSKLPGTQPRTVPSTHPGKDGPRGDACCLPARASSVMEGAQVGRGCSEANVRSWSGDCPAGTCLPV